MVSLDKTKKSLVRVVKITGSSSTVKKLENMGITEGSVIKKVFSYKSGPIIVNVKSSNIAIGRGMAGKIFVEEIE